MKEWHDKRLNDIFGNPPQGRTVNGDTGTRYYDAYSNNYDIEFDNDPTGVEEMKPLLDELTKAGIPWSFGHTNPF